MLTSEQQKIYNVKVPKGGYCYYTLYHGIYDPENNIDERPVYAQTGDLFEPEGSSVVYKATRKNGKTTWAIDENAQRQSESGESGGGSGGGGAEKFVVTLTKDNDTWTADKTVAETVAAYDEDQIVVCRVPFKDYNVSVEIPCWFAQEGAAAFEGVITFDNVLTVEVTLSVDGGEDEVSVSTTLIPTSTYAPLIVTLTEGSTEGQYVGNKTYKEVYDAFMAGQSCILNIPAVLGGVAVLAVDHETDYALSAYSDISASGEANDYITVTIGG